MDGATAKKREEATMAERTAGPRPFAPGPPPRRWPDALQAEVLEDPENRLGNSARVELPSREGRPSAASHSGKHRRSSMMIVTISRGWPLALGPFQPGALRRNWR